MQNPDEPAIPMPPRQRILLALSVMLASIIQVLDTTIANVALPDMSGALGATHDQIAWVLTSYIVASAICTPLSGYLTERLGRRRIFIVSVVGFTLASALCGTAGSLQQMVVFRMLQGVFGAALVPLSQAVFLDIFSEKQRPMAMAAWGMAVMVGPVVGPALGGLLTESYNWRWVFYVNVPLGVVALIGLSLFLHDNGERRVHRFDFLGFGLLSLAIASFQLVLDRGQEQSWFDSAEIVVEAVIAVVCCYVFWVHMMTSKNAYLNKVLFHDRNFVLGLLIVALVGIVLVATSALIPSFLQQVYNYPVLDAGLLTAPRGFAMVFGMQLATQVARRYPPRVSIGVGFAVVAASMWGMTQLGPEMDLTYYIIVIVVQGIGAGLIIVPMSLVTFATLPATYRNEGTALYSLMRNVGASVGISIVMSYLAHRVQANHAIYGAEITPFNTGLRLAEQQGVLDMNSTLGLTLIDATVDKQALLMAYLQDFRLVTWIVLAAVPLVFLLKPARPRTGASAESEPVPI